MNVARVFSRQTPRTPDDAYAFTGPPGLFVPKDIDKVLISVTFTYDKLHAEYLAEQWKHIAPVEIGGPAYGKAGGEFTPGLFLKRGSVITSRGCPNKCWFCTAWQREGGLHELATVHDGYDLCDDNILATRESHIRKVFKMLRRQRQQIKFTGGLEAARLKDWHLELIKGLNRKPIMYFAYDEDADYEPLVEAAKKLRRAGLMYHNNYVKCYMLMGWAKDTKGAAVQRISKATELGFKPMALLYRSNNGSVREDWRAFHRQWASPMLVGAKLQAMKK